MKRQTRDNSLLLLLYLDGTARERRICIILKYYIICCKQVIGTQRSDAN